LAKILFCLLIFIKIQSKVFNTNESQAGGKFGSFDFALALACVAGAKANVPMCVGIKLFFKMCGGKNLKT